MDGTKLPPLGGPVDTRPHAPPPLPPAKRPPIVVALVSAAIGGVIGFSLANVIPHDVPRPPPVETHIGPPPSVGRVEIATEPPARVRIDETAAGTTPLTISLAPGKHVVTLEGGAQDRFDLDVYAGETTHVLRTYVTQTAVGAIPVPEEGCDEVSCVLNDYETACCVKFDKRVHEGLERKHIVAGVAAVKPQIAACGDRSTAKGTVKLHVKVAPSGQVTSVSAEQTPDAKLG